ncbi:hypothetical protein [Silvimonas iriomotensis]|uniref:HDOD domain-containing protein n=1 Tax=Silvimonas iriomotensis TaxID=449662 RepID=A0ABQ2P695_9NEIS|nr:hypothetical protein [Silvimonas iriomotensis]GGP18764.1 hypothetical protein GCM10010970_07000 [Silvimonas iriomotensis]
MAVNLAPSFAPWIAEWTNRPLPMLQASKDLLLPMLRRPDRVRPVDLVDIVLRDPLLTAQVLRTVNHRERTSLSADVVSVENCVALYGIGPFLERFANGPVAEASLLPDHPAGVAQLHSAVMSLRFAARLAREYATQRFDAKLDEIFIAAVLSGLPALLNILGQNKSTAAQTDSAAHDMLVAWHFPEPLVQLQAGSAVETPRQTLQVAVLKMARALEHGWWQPEIEVALQVISGVLQTATDECWDIATTSILKFARKEARAGRLPAAYALPMLPGPWEPVAPAEPEAPPAPAANLFAERLHALNTAARQGANASQLIELALRVFTDGMHIQRAAFMVYSAADNLLRTRFVQSPDEQDRMRDFALPMDNVHLFARLMTKPQAVWLNEHTRNNLQKLLPGTWLQRFGAGDFCAMSIFMNERPVGLFIGQRTSLKALDETTFTQFKQVCLLVSRALAERNNRA